MVKNGFKDLILMGDHGVGQKELADLAVVLDRDMRREAPMFIFVEMSTKNPSRNSKRTSRARVCPQALMEEFPIRRNCWRCSRRLRVGAGHYKTTVGDPVPPAGQQPDPKLRRVNNGITGDPRLSTAELGKIFIDIRVRNAVAQIQSLIGSKRGTAR